MTIELTPQQVNIVLQALNSAIIPVKDCRIVLNLIDHIEKTINDTKSKDYTQV